MAERIAAPKRSIQVVIPRLNPTGPAHDATHLDPIVESPKLTLSKTKQGPITHAIAKAARAVLNTVILILPDENYTL